MRNHVVLLCEDQEKGVATVQCHLDNQKQITEKAATNEEDATFSKLMHDEKTDGHLPENELE